MVTYNGEGSLRLMCRSNVPQVVEQRTDSREDGRLLAADELNMVGSIESTHLQDRMCS